MKYEIKNIFFIFNISFLSFLIFISLLIVGSKERSVLGQEIHMIIRGAGNKTILGNDFPVNNFEILVNGIKNNSCNRTCVFKDDINNITVKFNEIVTSCYSMFFGSKADEIDLSNFDTSFVTDMTGMFYYCKKITSINLNNINTSLVKFMNYTFSRCIYLESIDLSYFDTSNVLTMENMFKNSENLKFINLSHFNTSLIENISSMFHGCSSLQSVYFPNFNSKQINSMSSLFYECRNLSYISFQNIDTSLTNDMNHMFCECNSLAYINLSQFNTSNVENMEAMFANCTNLQSLDLTNFKTSKAKKMGNMFNGCRSLSYIDVSKFDTRNVLDIHKMFGNCTSLLSIDVSNFDTSLVTDISAMFNKCKSLYSINLSNFDTSNVTDMHSIFTECTNLTLLDISSFNTSLVTNMFDLFADCSSLSSLNLSHFDTSKVIDIHSMFQNCVKLTSIDLSNFDISKSNNTKSMFAGCTALKQIDISNFYFSNVTSFENMFKDCNSLQYLNLCSFEIDENMITNNNLNNLLNGIANDAVFCINNNRTRYIFYSPNKIFTCEDKCYNESIILDTTYYNYYYTTNMIEPNVDSTYLDFYTTLNIEYSSNKVDNNPNTENHIQTTENIFQNTESIYSIHGTEEINDNTNDIQQSETKNDNYLNTNSIQAFNNEIDTLYAINYTDTNDFERSNSIHYNTEINDLMKPIQNFDNNTHLYNLIIENILSQYSPNKSKSMAFEGEENTIFQITSLKNELELLKNRSNNIDELSIIDLGQCETTLKSVYYINESESLIIIKRELKSNKASEKGVKYDVYEPYNKTKLNLSYCNETSIKLYVPIVLSEETRQMYEEAKKSGYNIFDRNDPFYNDICTPYDSSSGTDMLLTDRMDYIFNNDDTQCQSNCKLSMYNLESQYLECDCSPNHEVVFENKKNEEFKAKKFYIVFYDVLRYSNYDVLKCYKVLLSVNTVTKNIGSIFAIFCFLIYLICLFHYAFKKLIPLRDQLGNELKKLNDKNYRNVRYKIIGLFNPPIKKKPSNIKLVNSKIMKQKLNKIKSKPKFNKNSKNSKDSFEIYSGSRSQKNIIVNLNFDNSDKIRINNQIKIYNKINQEVKKSQKLSDFELSELEYKEATKLDKRNLCETYWARLKREHLIIFTFFNYNDFNLVSVKISRFVFLVVGDMAFNVFFFTDDSMHKLYLNYGKYDFVQQVPQMVYSIFLSQIIEIFLCYLSMTDKYIYELKSNLQKGKYNQNLKSLVKNIRVKLNFFFAFTFLFLIGYWYIISVFCAVYRNTQLIFFKDSVYSFGMGLVYPLFFYFISAIFRICSLRDKQKNSECLYKFSDVIPLF